MGVQIADIQTKKSILLLSVFFILIITCISYLPSLKNEFTNWDDPLYVIENALLNNFPGDVKAIFSANVASNYHPLTILSYALEYKVWGLNPVPFHVDNLILHLLNTLLVFWFIFLLSGRKIEVAFIVALFFGIHPMHVESVAWISARKDLLYTLFFISGLVSYYYYLHKEKNKILLYAVIFILFMLSLLSKAVAVSFPLVMFLMDIYSGRRINKWVFIEKIPFLISSIIFGVVAINAQTGAYAEHGVFSISQRFLFASYGMMDYILKFFFPINLSAFHPYPDLLHELPNIFYLSPIVALIFVFGIYKSIKYTKIILFGFLFYFFSIALVLQFISVGSVLMADRYSYLPYIGLFFIIGRGYSYLHDQKEKKFVTYKYLSLIILSFYAILFSYLTFNRCKIWKNSETLWTDVIDKYGSKAETAYKNRGSYYAGIKKYDLALKDCNTYISLKKDDPRIYSNRGIIYSVLKNYEAAIQDYNTALAMDPNLIKDYPLRGFAYLQHGDFKKAVDDYTEVIGQAPANADAFFYRAIANFNLKGYDAASIDYTKSIELNPKNPNSYINRGMLRQEQKQYALAIEDYDKAIALNPNLIESYNNRGFTKISTGDFEGAIEDLDAVLKRDTLSAIAYNNRGYAKLMLNDLNGALSDINKSIRIKPDNSLSFRNRALVNIKQNKISNACEDLHSALSLGFIKQWGNEVINLLNQYCKSDSEKKYTSKN